eukprot:scaffold2783_cov129-Cylindrotheca_fusiformis.AAC.10
MDKTHRHHHCKQFCNIVFQHLCGDTCGYWLLLVANEQRNLCEDYRASQGIYGDVSTASVLSCVVTDEDQTDIGSNVLIKYRMWPASPDGDNRQAESCNQEGCCVIKLRNLMCRNEETRKYSRIEVA